MKTITILLLTLACLLTAVAQTNPPAPADAPVTNSVAVAPAADTNAPVTPPAVVADTNAAATAAPAPATEPDTNAATAGIPQIKFSDVPITTAIENLARLAGINYMLDPKIGYGQPDANGQIKVEPTLSIRWENITAESALLALLDNYGLQLTHDKRTGIDRITMKDPTAPPPLFTKVIQLKYASVSNLVEHAQSVLSDKRSKVLTDPRTSQLVVVATDPEQQAVESLVAQLDKPTRQVLIETRLVEISSNPTTTKGVDWSGTLASQHVNFGNGSVLVAKDGKWNTSYPGTGTTSSDGAGGTITTPSTSDQSGSILNTINPYGTGGGGGLTWNTKSGFTPATGFLNADGLSAVLSFLNASSDAQVMSTPRIVTLDNELATIEVTRTYPVFNVTASTANTTAGSSVNYSNVGTTLYVTPRISANDYIWLHVIPVVSSFFGYGTGPNGLIAPEFDSRKIETQVLIPNANTLVLGGLVKDNPAANYTKVPVLGDIPGLGFFFRSENKSLDKDNLLIFITPTIIKDSDFQVATKSGDFLKSTPERMKQTMNPKRAWDSPVPRGNWSDPIPEASR
jgi:type II secretory pathway component GspD/PulD (secretin)